MPKQFALFKLFSRKMMLLLFLSICITVWHSDFIFAGPAEEAAQILKSTGIQGGLVVHFGCGDGKLTAELWANDSYLVHGLDTDAANITKARERIHALGLYGRVSAEHFTGKYLPYADNLVNLFVSENLGDIPMDEVLRVLVPNGVACIKKGKDWTKTVKSRPQKIDEWTHFLHDASNNAVADDSVVGHPNHLQWVDGPAWARSHEHLASISAVVSAGGRLFYIVDEGPTVSVALPSKWFLVARDAFNGVLLWKRPIGTWEGHLRDFRTGPSELPRRLVAVKDRVYVTLGYGEPVRALDAATGKTVKTYEETENTTEIIYHDGMLFCVLGIIDPVKAAESAKGYAAMPAPINKSIMVIKADTGDRLWEKSGVDTAQLMPTTLAVANEGVFFQNTKEIICLNKNSGDEVWRVSRPISINRPSWSTPTLVVQDGVVLSADRKAPKQAEEGPVKWSVNWEGGKGAPGELIAYSAKTGEKLWSCRCHEGFYSPVDVLVAGGLVWTGDLTGSRSPGMTAGRDLHTGEVKKRRPADKAFIKVGMIHHRCYRNKATNRYLLLGRAGIEFLDIASGKISANHWVRGSCQYGIMPCNGLIYAPQHSCACYIKAKLNGFNALVSKREPKSTKLASQSVDRLEKGPAYSQEVVSEERNQETWPTYRHDPARSGSTKVHIPTGLDRLWSCDLGGKLSSVTIAEGRVFVVQVDSHTVCSLDAQDGKQVWSYTVGGRVDSPPTISQGLVLFGSADGYVYCLRASDGQLVWRFRAARDDRRIVAYGQLESVWPVHGSVLIQEGIVYFAAGRSSFLDGGIYLYGLDLKTGIKLSARCINSRNPETGEEPQKGIQDFNMPGALPDILSSNGKSIYMRHTRFDLEGVRQEEKGVPHLFSPAGFLDDTWWHRTYWTFGSDIDSGWSHWPRFGNIMPAGRLLVFDGSNIYGYGRDKYTLYGGHLGFGKIKMRLFAASLKPLRKKPDKKESIQFLIKLGVKREGYAPGGKSTVRYHWSQGVPIIVRAMVLADSTLLTAGPPEIAIDEASSLASLEGEQGAFLYMVSSADGKELAKYELDSSPVFDGMAAAYGRLYLSTTKGNVICFAGK